MNKEHHFNLLTPNYCDEVTRGINSMYQNSNISTILMKTHFGKQFCNGTDFKALSMMAKEGSTDAICDYLQKIY